MSSTEKSSITNLWSDYQGCFYEQPIINETSIFSSSVIAVFHDAMQWHLKDLTSSVKSTYTTAAVWSTPRKNTHGYFSRPASFKEPLISLTHGKFGTDFSSNQPQNYSFSQVIMNIRIVL